MLSVALTWIITMVSIVHTLCVIIRDQNIPYISLLMPCCSSKRGPDHTEPERCMNDYITFFVPGSPNVRLHQCGMVWSSSPYSLDHSTVCSRLKTDWSVFNN